MPDRHSNDDARAVLLELLDRLTQARSLADVNIAAGIASQQLTGTDEL